MCTNGKSLHEMERLSEKNRIKVAEAKTIENGYLKESEMDQHLELSSSLDRLSERVSNWVDQEIENQKGPELVPSYLKFATRINRESGKHQHRNVTTAGTSPRPSSPHQTLGCDQQGYLFQSTVSFSDGKGIKHAVSTKIQTRKGSVPILYNIAL